VSNILAAVAALDRVGYPLERSIEGLADFTGPEGRVQFVPVDADSVSSSMPGTSRRRSTRCCARCAPPGRIITVIGSNGNRDAHKRPLMGRFSAMASDVVVVTDDNPADEDPAMIRRAVVAGTRGSSAQVFEVAGRAEAIHHAVDLAEAGDLLVIVGKGDERHQITAHGIVPHSDPDEVEWPSRASGPAGLSAGLRPDLRPGRSSAAWSRAVE
jgi:UDP-N-acetylmuramoyl-L-alanyl-D-glutamate--2,6-diaminopimelate ligase